MGFVAGTNVVEIDMIYSWNGENCENVYHVQMPAAVTLGNLNALVSAFVNWESTSMISFRSNTVQLIEVVATDLTTQFGPQVIDTLNPPIAGAQTGAVLPNNCTIAVGWRTDSRGRSRRGRTFHIGLMEAYVTNNRLTPGAVLLVDAGYGALPTAVATVTGAQLVVFSKQENNVPLNPGHTHVITHQTLNTVVDSQKRRLPEHNKHH